MAQDEHPEKHSWWLNELESLGINTREKRQLRDPKKLASWQWISNRCVTRSI